MMKWWGTNLPFANLVMISCTHSDALGFCAYIIIKCRTDNTLCITLQITHCINRRCCVFLF